MRRLNIKKHLIPSNTRFLKRCAFCVVALLAVWAIVWKMNDNAKAYRWQAVAPDAEFTVRDGAGLLSLDGKLFLMGGWKHPKHAPADTTNEVWRSDNDGANWTLLGNAPWANRHCAGYASFKGKLWVISGDGNTDVWSSKDGITWDRATADAPWGKRYSPYVVVFKDRLWLIGGQSPWDGNGENKNYTAAFNDVWSSADGAHWQLETPHANFPARGLIHGSAVFDGKIWVMGGGIKGVTDEKLVARTLSEFNDVWASEDGKNWTRVLKNAPWLPRTHMSIAAFDGNLFVTDGSVTKQPNLSNEVWFSPDGIRWKEIKGTPWSKRHASSLVVHKGRLYIAQGLGSRDVWALTKATGSR